LSGDIGSLSKITTGLNPLPATGISSFAVERLPGERNGEIDFTAWFNPSANQAHSVLKLLPAGDIQVGYFRGTVLGNSGAGCVVNKIDYKGKRGADGSLSFDTNALSNGFGLEWGRQLTAGIRTDTTATNGTGIQSGSAASTAFGFQAYLWVFAFTGTSATIKIQDSPDNSVYTDLANGSFGTFTTGGVSRVAGTSAQTVNQWARIITTGTFSNAQFAALFMRNYATVLL